MHSKGGKCLYRYEIFWNNFPVFLTVSGDKKNIF